MLYHADPAFESMLQHEWNDWRGRVLPRAMLAHFLRGNRRLIGRSVVVTHSVEDGLLLLKARSRSADDNLSPREHLVALQLVKGSTHKQIAQMLDRSPATVRNQIRSIDEKLAVTRVAGLAEERRLAA